MSYNDALLRRNNIHTSAFPYFSSVYMTYFSVIQGVILSASFLYFLYGFVYGCPKYSLLLLPVMSFSVLIWHNYVSHHQLVGWQLGFADTYFIGGFGFSQLSSAAVPITLIQEVMTHKVGQPHIVELFWMSCGGPFICVIFFMILSAIIGFIAYWYSIRNLSISYVRKIISQNYKTDVYELIVGAENIMLRLTGWSVVVLVVVLVIVLLIDYCRIVGLHSDIVAIWGIIGFEQIIAIVLFLLYVLLIPIYDIKAFLKKGSLNVWWAWLFK